MANPDWTPATLARNMPVPRWRRTVTQLEDRELQTLEPLYHEQQKLLRFATHHRMSDWVCISVRRCVCRLFVCVTCHVHLTWCHKTVCCTKGPLLREQKIGSSFISCLCPFSRTHRWTKPRTQRLKKNHTHNGPRHTARHGH